MESELMPTLPTDFVKENEERLSRVFKRIYNYYGSLGKFYESEAENDKEAEEDCGQFLVAPLQKAEGKRQKGQ